MYYFLRFMVSICLCLTVGLFNIFVVSENKDSCNVRPHIVFFLADDMGWNDIGWNNEDIFTPNLDKLAKDGIILNQSYFLPLCSPSRSSLLTGYYSFRTGMQGEVVTGINPAGLPLQFTTLAEKLRDQGYATHIIGKWNLGFCSWEYTPTYRGFDSFFGFYGSVEQHYNHTTFVDKRVPSGRTAYDFRNNTEVAWEYYGIHSSVPFIKQAKQIIEHHDASKPLFLFFSSHYPHLPHEVPKEFENYYKYSTVKNSYRKKFMARMTALDYDIGEVIASLKQHRFYENSIIAFSSDNGGGHTGGGSNHPLRGAKATLYEGGTRVPGFFHSSLLLKKGFVYNGLMHAVDWLPTFVAIAGGSSDSKLDGINMWPAITRDLVSPRKEMVYNIIATGKEFRGAIRVENWKLIIGKAGTPSKWYLPEEALGDFFNMYFEPATEVDETNNSTMQLFNLSDDPYESVDLSEIYPNKVKNLYKQLVKYKKHSVPPFVHTDDANGDPIHYNGTFTPGWCLPLFSALERKYTD